MIQFVFKRNSAEEKRLDMFFQYFKEKSNMKMSILKGKCMRSILFEKMKLKMNEFIMCTDYANTYYCH